MDSPQELSPRMLSHFTRIDYDLHMAFIAVTARGGEETQVGVARYMFGDVLNGNDKMLRLATRLGFSARLNEADPRLMRIEVNL